MEDQQKNNKSELWNLGIKDLFFKYVRFLPLFLLSVALALLIAFAYLRYATRIYSVGGSMLLKTQQASSSRNDKVEDIISGNSRSQNIQSEIEILKSRPLMTRVVKKLNLQFSYIAEGKIIKDLNVYKQTPFVVHAFEIEDSSASFSMAIKYITPTTFQINGEAKIFSYNDYFRNKYGVFKLVDNGVASAGMEFKVLWRPAEVVANELVGSLNILPKSPGTGILTIGLKATNSQMAADIVNALMVQYDSVTIEQNNLTTDQMLSFISTQLDTLKFAIDSLQNGILAYSKKNDLINVEAQSDNYLSGILESEKLANEQMMKLSVANMIDGYLKNKKNEYLKLTVPSSLGLEDITLNELVAAYNKSQFERESLLQSNIPVAHPSVKEVEAIIEKQRESIIENIKNIKVSYNATINTLQSKSVLERNGLQNLPFKAKDLIELERQVTTKRGLFALLEGKKLEASISRASTISNSSIIEKAAPSSVPVSPNKRAIQLIAVLVGLGLPALIIFILEVTNDKISTRYDIERITNAPIMGEIGHSFSEKVLVVDKVSRSMVAEQFRIIRSNLQYVLNKTERPSILVTSSYSGEGKSFVSTNMGAVLALTGKKTVILEFDIRKPKVLSGLGMKKSAGISNFLVGKAELKDLIVQVPDKTNLYVLPCGPIPPNPSELLLESKVAEMFEWLRKEFEVIIIDTAPVGMVSDAMTLGKFADSTLYLVRQGHTYKKQVTLIDELYRENKLPKVSIVINDVKLKPGYGYYGYGRYGYGYGYVGKGQSNYYEEDVEPPTFIDRLLKKLDITKWFRKKK